jgi:hypothetical protein
MKAASAQGLAAFLLVQRTIMLFVIAIVQSFTGAAYFSHNFVRNQSSEPCQHGHTQQLNQHRYTLSGVPPFLSHDCYKVAGIQRQAMANMPENSANQDVLPNCQSCFMCGYSVTPGRFSGQTRRRHL